MGHGQFAKFHCKRAPSNGEAVGHAWLIYLAWKNGIFCYYSKLFSFGYALAQHSIPRLSVGTTLVPPFWSWRYMTGEGLLMRVVCNYLIY